MAVFIVLKKCMKWALLMFLPKLVRVNRLCMKKLPNVKNIVRAEWPCKKVMARTEPVDYDELLDVCQIWVKAAMQLSEKDLRMMSRLVKAQDRKIQSVVFDSNAAGNDQINEHDEASNEMINQNIA